MMSDEILRHEAKRVVASIRANADLLYEGDWGTRPTRELWHDWEEVLAKHLVRVFRTLVGAEREACAVLADPPPNYMIAERAICEAIAAAIRARGQQKEG